MEKSPVKNEELEIRFGWFSLRATHPGRKMVIIVFMVLTFFLVLVVLYKLL